VKKDERKKRVKNIRRNNPCATLQVIGDEVGLSRERVRQILKKEGLTTAHYIESPYKFFCPECGKPTRWKFCNKQCRDKYLYIPVTCDNCGKINYRLQSTVLYRVKNKLNLYNGHYFCNKRCQGQWMGKQNKAVRS